MQTTSCTSSAPRCRSAPALILVAYGHVASVELPTTGTTDRTASIGYDHFLSKNTDIYVAAMYEKLTLPLSSGNAHRRRRARLRF